MNTSFTVTVTVTGTEALHSNYQGNEEVDFCQYEMPGLKKDNKILL